MKIKETILHIKEYVYQHPKAFYKYSMIILVISLLINVWIEIKYPPNYFEGVVGMPRLFKESDKKIESIRKNREKDLEKSKEILDELKILGKKREMGKLTNDDSIRVEYLFNQYNEINNGSIKKN